MEGIKPKVLAYIPLFYGAEYLEACIRSMHPFVEKIIIVYTPVGSQGHDTSIPCPETRDELYAIAMCVNDELGKIEWHDTNGFANENAHRRYILQHAEGYDLVFTLDADEIVEPQDIELAFQMAYESQARHIRLEGFINFWRSFNHVCLDGFLPFRIVNLRNRDGNDTVKCRVYHFSTCQAEKTVRFKWLVSGHKNELRSGWIDHVYLAWTPENNFGNLHPVALDLWNAAPFDKNLLPDVLKQHPNFEKSIV